MSEQNMIIVLSEKQIMRVRDSRKLKDDRSTVEGACETTVERHAKRQCRVLDAKQSAARPNRTTSGVTVTDHCRQLLSHPKKFDDRMGVTRM